MVLLGSLVPGILDGRYSDTYHIVITVIQQERLFTQTTISNEPTVNDVS